MVSKARLDLPDPERPVITISELRGSSRSTSLRLCSLAPRMTIRSDGAIHIECTQANGCSHLSGWGRGFQRRSERDLLLPEPDDGGGEDSARQAHGATSARDGGGDR